MSTTTETVRNDAALTIPAGFRRATDADLTDRPDAWVGPKIHGPSLVNGRPETAAVLTWAPDEGLTPVLNANIYPEGASLDALDDALGRLEAMLEYAALAAKATSPSALARAYRSSNDNAYNFPAPWEGNDTRDLVLNTHGDATVEASTVMGGDAPIGVHLTIALDDFESLGLDVLAESNLLELTGTREQIAAVAGLFAKMGDKLKTFLASEPVN